MTEVIEIYFAMIADAIYKAVIPLRLLYIQNTNVYKI